MKTLPIRKFTTVVSYLTEAVAITNDGKVIGTFTPAQNGGHVEEPVKKAIEPDKAKEVGGQMRKGLGPLPGEAPTPTRPDPAYQRFNPVPKPKGK
jgi:hypothetical protein